MTGVDSKGPGWRVKGALLASSLLCSLLLAEAGARLLHRGAFVYLNLFEADPRYGVRLRPHATARLRSRSGRITTVQTNQEGFRGPEWPAPDSAPAHERWLLLGDSQVFGYNVPYADTFASQLPSALGRPIDVLNAAVPSWGPPEYVSILSELAPRYHPKIVLFVANAANDWFEAHVPNVERTTAIDGWATRALPNVPPPSDFPGRRFLMGQSHLILAARELGAAQARGIDTSAADAARRLLHDLPTLERNPLPHRSRLGAPLLEAARICRDNGCTVAAVALPIDVQVDPREWHKYPLQPVPLAPTERLLRDFVAQARAAGLPAVDLLPPLRAASPGAFLNDDYHLSAKGHRRVAEALAAALAPHAPSTHALAQVRP